MSAAVSNPSMPGMLTSSRTTANSLLQEAAQRLAPRRRRQDVLVQVGQDGREREQLAGVVVDHEDVDAVARLAVRLGRVQRHSHARSTDSICSVSTGLDR